MGVKRFSWRLVLISILVSAAARADRLTFPDGFRWCVATSGHQIEGNNVHSDWWEWERTGHTKTGETSGKTCDHWNRVEEDTRHLKELGATQYRFSVEWPKIEPEEGRWDPQAVQHYRDEVALLQKSGIQPLITINHYTLPLWVSRKGGWSWDGAPEAFARFSAYVYEHVAPTVEDWITLNEPMVMIYWGYFTGEYPPGMKQPDSARLPLRHMIQAHARAYHRLHAMAEKEHRTIRIGVAHHLRIFQPLRGGLIGRLDDKVATTMDRFFNWVFPEALETGRLSVSLPDLKIDELIPEAANTQDFFGLNYYSREIVRFKLLSRTHFELIPASPGEAASDVGWRIYPQGFYLMLKTVQARFGAKPILVTENGIADANDSRRARFLIDHLAALHRAIQEGVPVRSYCHWSLVDNFEWIEGYPPRYGLFSIDYATETRTLRESGRVFSKIARENALTR